MVSDIEALVSCTVIFWGVLLMLLFKMRLQLTKLEGEMKELNNYVSVKESGHVNVHENKNV